MKRVLLKTRREICGCGRERKRKRIAARLTALLVLLCAVIGAAGCAGGKEEDDLEDIEISDTSEESYGVFLGINSSTFDISLFDGYDQVVVDAQELSRKQLAQLHESGHVVCSYLNVGSIEKSREYFDEYKDLCLDRYENWPDENWVDVTQERWQEFVGSFLLNRILDRDPDIDGLFLDNLDIYYHVSERKKYRSMAEDVYDSLVDILESYKEAGLPVLVNGADVFVSRLLDEGREELIRGVNQETVFSSILDYDDDRFGEQSKEDNASYTEYLARCEKAGIDIYLLEYATDRTVKAKICRYCRENGFRFYISGYVNLDAGVQER